MNNSLADSMVMAPPWLPMGLGAAFLIGAVYYVFRLSNPAYLKRINGYIDPENEFWHGLCLLAMVTSLAPALAPIPASVWTWVLPVGTCWYLLRTFTWGRTRPFNKAWYDLAHAAMFFGMWWMYAQPVESVYATWAFTAYWSWFGGYYVYRLVSDLRPCHWLSITQDIFHLGMAVVMVVMTQWPMYLMPM